MKAFFGLRGSLSASTVAVLALSVSPCDAALEIRHSELARYSSDLTRAYEECTAPNDVSSDGVAACNPPLTSACDYSSGTVELIPNAPETRVRIRLLGASGPGTCATGTYDTLLVLRITLDDAAVLPASAR